MGTSAYIDDYLGCCHKQWENYLRMEVTSPRQSQEDGQAPKTNGDGRW